MGISPFVSFNQPRCCSFDSLAQILWTKNLRDMIKSFRMCPECVRVLPALCRRGSQTVGLFSPVRLCPLGMVTGELLISTWPGEVRARACGVQVNLLNGKERTETQPAGEQLNRLSLQRR